MKIIVSFKSKDSPIIIINFHEGGDRDEGTSTGGGGGDFLLPEAHSDAHSIGTTDDDSKPHRLQRQKHQSRKTFRFRKSRKGDRGEVKFTMYVTYCHA